MQVQYASFVSLVLHDVHGNSPIFPFDPSTGNNGNHGYHYHPDVTLKELEGELGFCVSHYQDNDSRRICCLQCSDETHTSKPNLLSDAVTQGFAAWGGKVLTPSEALSLAQELQPNRVEEWDEPDSENPESTTHYTKTIGAISLDMDDYLTRTVNVETS